MYKPSRSKKLIAFVVMFFLTLSMMTQGIAAVAKESGAPKVFDLIEITDLHGAIVDASNRPVGGVLAQNINEIKKANPDRTLILGGGDLYQGMPISNVLKGVPVQKVLNQIGMEITTLGNHEFDWGLDTIINTSMKGAKYSIVCSNLYDKATGKRVFDPYKIIEKDGVKIGIIGGITNETPTIVLPKYVEPYKFTDLADEINSSAAEARSKGADIVIALIHEGGVVGNDGTKSGPVFEIAKKLNGVDAILGGHTHTIVNSISDNGIPIFIANSSGKGFQHIKMTVDENKKVAFAGEYVDIYTDKPNGYKAANPIVDPQVTAIVDAANAELGPMFNEVIGKADDTLTRTQLGNPFGESFLGNWSSDVIRKKAGADVGMQNNGGLRIDTPKGDITVGTIFALMPFDNEICILDMSKAQIKTVLEQGFADNGKGIQLSGLKVKYDMSRPNMDRVVEISREDGTSINDAETLKVATNDFMATGGDGFLGFVDAGGKEPDVNTHVLIRDALIEDVRANKSIKTTLDSRIENAVKYISIVATSDLHGNIYPYDYFTTKPADLGLAKISTYVSSLRKYNPNVMVIDNGDAIQGTPLVTYYNLIDQSSEYPMMKVMGKIGYDTWTLGNHEFNYGLPTLNRIIKDAKANNINVLSANIYKDDNTNFVEPYYIKSFDVNGKTIKVGVIGMTTKTVPSWEDAAHYKGLKFNDLVDEAKKWVPKLRKEGADIVIAAAHSGEEGPADTIPENQIKAIATQVSGIDAIVAGHMHVVLNDLSLKNPDGKVVPVVEPGKYGQNVSQIDIGVGADGKIISLTTNNIKMDSTIPADAEITEKIAKPYQDATLKYVKTKIGVSKGEYTGDGQTLRPTAIMELINKVQMEGAGTQLSIAAPLSASARIPEGDITIQDIMSVYVYENFLYGIKMNGKQIKDWLEWSARYYGQVSSPNEPIAKDAKLNIPDYNLDQLYGATYDIDITEPAGSRIKNLRYNGKPIKADDVFTVAINNYRYNGGGGFMNAAGISNTDPSLVVYDSAKALGDDGQVRNMMIKYIEDHKTITPTVSENWKIYTTTVQNVESGSLPKTGSPIDTASVVNLGGLFISLGVVTLNKSRKEDDLAA